MLPRPYHDILEILEAEVTADHCLFLKFDDGVEKEVNVYPKLRGPVFEPLKDPAYFRLVRVDPQAGTVVWPNGADYAPEALWDLPDIRETR
jgi:hypothetical protein